MAGDILVFIAMGMTVAGTLRYLAAPGLLLPQPLLWGGLITQVILQFGLLGASKAISRAGVIVAILGIAVFLGGSYRRSRRQHRSQSTPDDRRVASITGVGNNPQAVVLSQDGSHAYVPAADRPGTLAVVDLRQRTVSALIRVGRGAADALPLSSDGRVLVSVAGVRGRLIVADTVTGKATHAVAEIRSPRGMAASPDGATVYVTSMSDSKIWRLDARTLTVTGSAAVSGRAVAVAVSPDGERLYVACLRSSSVAIVNSRSLATIKTVALRAAPVRLAVGGGDLVYAMCLGGVAAVVDIAAARVIGSGRLGEHEGSVAVGRDGDPRWYVTDPWGGTLTALAARSTAVSETLAFGKKAPIDVAVGPGGLLCVACQTGVLDLVRFRRAGITDAPHLPSHHRDPSRAAPTGADDAAP